MAKTSQRAGDRHLDNAKTIRMTDEQLALLEALKAKTGGTYADAITAAARAFLGASEPSNAELIAMLQARLPKETIKLARGVVVKG